MHYDTPSCTTEIHTENQYFILLVKPRVQPRFLHRLLLLCFSCNPVIPKNKKSPETFPFFGQNPYICISSKSRAKQCSETRTATKSLPVTELPTLYVLSIKLLKEIYRFYIKKPPDRTFYVRTGDFYEQSLNSQQAGFNKFFYLLSGNRINRLQSIESGISCETELPFSLIYRYATS